MCARVLGKGKDSDLPVAALDAASKAAAAAESEHPKGVNGALPTELAEVLNSMAADFRVPGDSDVDLTFTEYAVMYTALFNVSLRW